MPSIHIGWALLVALVAVATARSRWRWLALAYPALTTLAVVVTANHFWLDGIAAAALLALALGAQRVAGPRARVRRPSALGPGITPAPGTQRHRVSRTVSNQHVHERAGQPVR